MNKTALTAGIFFAALSVIIGAFGAHALKQALEAAQQQVVFETAVRYQMYHSFALIATGILAHFFANKRIRLAAWFFIIGILLFSGSLYTMIALKIEGQVGLGGLGILTPIGGVFFVLGWIWLLIAVLKKES